MIVVEGVDNSGKSTLIRTLQNILPLYDTQGSEGPPKYAGEMNKRVELYLTTHPKRMIYDRHPCVSQPIYGTMRSHLDAINPRLIEQFYRKQPFFIYCDGGDRGMSAHTFNPETDTKEHLDAVRANYAKLLIQYRHWAAQHAHVVCRIGDDSMMFAQKIVEHLFYGR